MTDAYEIPRGFDFRTYTAESFGIEKGTRVAEVVIRFGPRQARWIRERKWHRSARIQEEIGGGLVPRAASRPETMNLQTRYVSRRTLNVSAPRAPPDALNR